MMSISFKKKTFSSFINYFEVEIKYKITENKESQTSCVFSNVLWVLVFRDG